MFHLGINVFLFKLGVKAIVILLEQSLCYKISLSLQTGFKIDYPLVVSSLI